MSRRLSLTPEQEDKLWRLHLQKVPLVLAAQEVGCHRQTAARAIQRIKTTLAEAQRVDFELARSQHLAELDGVKREAWASKAQCQPGSNAAVGYLGIVLDAIKQQSSLLGLDEITITHRAVALTRIQTILDAPIPLTLPGNVVDHD